MISSSRSPLAIISATALIFMAVLMALALRYSLALSAPFFERTELRTLDARFLLRGPKTPEELKDTAAKVAIVAMDDNATHTLGHPIPRNTHARLVEQMKKAGARAVIFDVIFADVSREKPAEDAAFAAAVASAGNVFLPFDHDSAEATPPALLKQVESRLSYPVEAASTAETIRIRPPIAPLLKAMKGGGQVAAKPDSDGTFRSSVLLMEAGKIYPHVVLDAVARGVWGLDASKTAPVLQGEYLVWDKHKLGPLTRRSLQRSFYETGEDSAHNSRTGTAWTIPLNFLGGHDAMQVLTISYLDVLQGRAGDRLKGRVVIVGETATGTPDIRRSPFDRQELFFGVETNATFIANLLDNNFLHYPALRWSFLACALMGLLTGAAAFGLRPGLSLLVAIFTLAGYGLLAASLFINDSMVLELTAPFLTIALSYTYLTAYRLVVTDRMARESSVALRETQTLLGQYVNENLAVRLSGNPEMRRDLQIGTRRDVTVLFSDIRGFTSWSEGQTPEEVKARLDEYFPTMCEIVVDDYEGDIDKFIGDGMMAVWNGLSDQEDHARRAVRAALSMKRSLGMLNDGWRKQKQEGFRIGIGIATGDAIFGTFGSPKHKLMPTVLGDTVNLASRLESLTKETGGVIIVSRETYEVVKEEFEFKELGTVPVRGKSEAQPVYEVLGPKKVE